LIFATFKNARSDSFLDPELLRVFLLTVGSLAGDSFLSELLRVFLLTVGSLAGTSFSSEFSQILSVIDASSCLQEMQNLF